MSPGPPQPLATQVRQMRELAGLTQQQLVGRTDGALTTGGLSRIETGARSPNVRTLETLSNALDVRFVIEGGRTRIERRGSS